MVIVETSTGDGTLKEFPAQNEKTDEDDAKTAGYNCDSLGGFPCWECV